MTPEAIPSGYQRVTSYLTVRDADRPIAFYKNAFGAEERMQLKTPDGKVGRAEITIGDSVIMLADEMKE